MMFCLVDLTEFHKSDQKSPGFEIQTELYIYMVTQKMNSYNEYWVSYDSVKSK